jgi:hypothetical protein
LFHLPARLILLSLPLSLLCAGCLLLSALLLHLPARVVLLSLLLRARRLLLSLLLLHLTARIVLLSLALSLRLSLLLTPALPLLFHLPSQLVVVLLSRTLRLPRRLSLPRLAWSSLLPGCSFFAHQLFHFTPRGPVTLLCSGRQFGDALGSLGIARAISSPRLQRRRNRQAVGSPSIDNLLSSVDLQLISLLFVANRLHSKRLPEIRSVRQRDRRDAGHYGPIQRSLEPRLFESPARLTVFEGDTPESVNSERVDRRRDRGNSSRVEAHQNVAVDSSP